MRNMTAVKAVRKLCSKSLNYTGVYFIYDEVSVSDTETCHVPTDRVLFILSTGQHVQVRITDNIGDFKIAMFLVLHDSFNIDGGTLRAFFKPVHKYDMRPIRKYGKSVYGTMKSRASRGCNRKYAAKAKAGKMSLRFANGERINDDEFEYTYDN